MMLYELRFPLVFCVFMMLNLQLAAADIRIGLFNAQEIETMVFSTVEGEYLLTGDGSHIAVIRKATMFFIERSGTMLEVHDTSRSYGTFSNLAFEGVLTINIFQVKPVFPALAAKESEDNLHIDIYHDHIRIVNTLDLEKYIPGTVESEGGSTAFPEYYKAQAVIVRTFAIRNFFRHAHEGFNLCDGVHCQAFNGKSRMNKEIYAATSTTAKKILVDRSNRPAVTAYHANCGGITGSAAQIWKRDLPYLVPVKDPFCDKSSHRNWDKSISSADWNEYLVRKGYEGNPDLLRSTDSGRQKYLDPDRSTLPLTELREDLKLKSSYFHIKRTGTSVIFHGHGYGHGLGLCQQGAMEMARVGYTYVDILMFYFTGLVLSDEKLVTSSQ